MRLTLLSSASVLILTAAVGQAVAAPDFTGVLQVYAGAGWVDQDNFGLADDPYDFGAKAQGYWSLSPTIDLQADLFVQQSNNIVQHWASSDSTTFGGALHLVHNYDDHWRAGIAGSIWSADVFDLPSANGQIEATYGLGALEAKYSGGNWSFTGQAGYFGDMSCGNCFLALTSGEFLRGKGRYYVSENTAVTAEAMEMWGSFDDLFFTNKSLHSTTLNLQAEHKFEASPYSGFLSVNYERDAITKDSTDSRVQTTTISLGFKYYYDQSSIQSNERTGADFDTPTFGHAVALGSFISY